MEYKAGAIWGGYQAPWDKIVYAITIGQQYLMQNTTLGIPAIVQSEGEIFLSHVSFDFKRSLGVHGFSDNGTTWPSAIGLAASFNAPLLQEAASTIATEAEGLGYSQIFAPVLDLSRELRWGRVEENYGEDPFLYVPALTVFVRSPTRYQNKSDGSCVCHWYPVWTSAQCQRHCNCSCGCDVQTLRSLRQPTRGIVSLTIDQRRPRDNLRIAGI